MRIQNFNYESFDTPERVVRMVTRQQFDQMFYMIEGPNDELEIRIRRGSERDRTIERSMLRKFGTVFRVKQAYRTNLMKLGRNDLDISSLMRCYSYIDESGCMYSSGWLKDAPASALPHLPEELFEL